MKVRIRWMAVLRDRMGVPESEVDLPEGARIRDLVQHLTVMYPEFEPYWRTIRFASEDAYFQADDPVPEGEVIYAIPPVSGGL